MLNNIPIPAEPVHNLLADRMAVPSKDSLYCNLQSLYDLYPKLATGYHAQSARYLSLASDYYPGPGKTYGLMLMVQGGLEYVKGQLEYILAKKESWKGGTKPDSSSHLKLARSHFRNCQEMLVAAMADIPRDLKIMFNLGLTYFNLYDIEMLSNDSNSASAYLELAEKAVMEAQSGILDSVFWSAFSYAGAMDTSSEYGSAVELAGIWLRKHRDFEPGNAALLKKADSVVNAVLNGEPGSSNDRLREEWRCQAHIRKAAIILYRMVHEKTVDEYADLDSALAHLERAEEKNHSKVCWAILLDDDFAQITALLEQHPCTSIRELRVWLRESHRAVTVARNINFLYN